VTRQDSRAVTADDADLVRELLPATEHVPDNAELLTATYREQDPAVPDQ
jgi:hypothetical protein